MIMTYHHCIIIERRNEMKWKNKRTYALFFLFIIIVSSTLTSSAFAGAFNEVSFGGNRANIMTETDSFYPNKSAYPFLSDKADIKQVSFDLLYGTQKKLTKYWGEISYKMNRDDKDEKYTSYRVYDSDNIAGIKRQWAEETPKLESNSDDYHIRAMEEKTEPSILGNFIQGFIGGLGKIADGFLFFINYIRTRDLIQIISEALTNGNDSFYGMMMKLVFIDPETGALSPFFIIAMVLWLISVVGLARKAFQGSGSFKVILAECGQLLIVILISAFAFMGNLPVVMSDISAKIVRTFSSEMESSFDTESRLKDQQDEKGITTAEKGFSKLFISEIASFEGENKDLPRVLAKNMNTVYNQQALLNKTSIETEIKAQFGVSNISQLNLDDEHFPNAQKNIEKITGGKDPNLFDVYGGSLKKDGGTAVKNLGYYWYAVNSSVDPQTYDGKDIKEGNKDKLLFIADFLNNVQKDAPADQKSKYISMGKHFTNPSYLLMMWNTFLENLQKFILIWCMIGAILFEIIGKAILAFGSVMYPILPSLYLIPKTRKLAGQISKTYLSGYARVVIGELVIGILYMVYTMMNGSDAGHYLNLILFAIFVKFAPRMYREINDLICRNEIPVLREHTKKLSGMWDNKNRNRNQYAKDLFSKKKAATGQKKNGAFGNKDKSKEKDRDKIGDNSIDKNDNGEEQILTQDKKPGAMPISAPIPVGGSKEKIQEIKQNKKPPIEDMILDSDGIYKPKSIMDNKYKNKFKDKAIPNKKTKENTADKLKQKRTDKKQYNQVRGDIHKRMQSGELTKEQGNKMLDDLKKQYSSPNSGNKKNGKNTGSKTTKAGSKKNNNIQNSKGIKKNADDLKSSEKKDKENNTKNIDKNKDSEDKKLFPEKEQKKENNGEIKNKLDMNKHQNVQTTKPEKEIKTEDKIVKNNDMHKNEEQKTESDAKSSSLVAGLFKKKDDEQNSNNKNSNEHGMNSLTEKKRTNEQHQNIEPESKKLNLGNMKNLKKQNKPEPKIDYKTQESNNTGVFDIFDDVQIQNPVEKKQEKKYVYKKNKSAENGVVKAKDKPNIVTNKIQSIKKN